MSQTVPLEASTEVSHGWAELAKEEDIIPMSQDTDPQHFYNIVCGLEFNKAWAQNLFLELQFMHGTMSMSLESIEDFKLTEPLAVNDRNQNSDQEKVFENERVWRAMSCFKTDAKPKAAFRAKLSVASAHVLLQENRQVWYVPTIYFSSGGSLWSQVDLVFSDSDFRSCRNFFSHSFLRGKFGNDLPCYKAIKRMYTKCVPIFEVLMEKLESALSDRNAWKIGKSSLSYSERPEYGLDTPEAEIEAEEQRQMKAKEALIVTPELSWCTEEETPETPNLPVDQDAIVEDPIVAWLAETWEWNTNYCIRRRQSWSHFYDVDTVDDGTDGRCWM
ncbi:hypothetical protein PMIN06_006856 [Paraphaeosphaeria minitans]|uniref:Uncharacterized protein n=1 Tax=Paraphaeosphaeria minitans TaxID=565426 RepID=A0A9P6GIC4_9PLEO|nr:hypothetical protein PMIN01_05833 [Paraphaeosphaeria minitans]